MERTLTEIKYIVAAKSLETARKRYTDALERDIFMAGTQYASKQFIRYLSTK